MKEELIGWRHQTIEWFVDCGIGESWAIFIQSVVVLLAILAGALILDILSTFLMRYFIPALVRRTDTDWDDILLKNKVFSKLAHFLPGIAMLILYPLIASDGLRVFIHNIMDTYFVVIALMFFNALINSLGEIYIDYKKERMMEIKIYIQVLKVIIFSLGFLYIISIFANENFVEILKGLGAMITVLLIVYKDTILGFVAGIQLSANNMIKIGDWISVPQSNADGTVVDISLNTVKVQNWDNTITTIPTYKMTSDSFTNWKGMEQSDGRRIKRHINIDMDSIRFLSDSEINEFKRFRLLEDYINGKEQEIKALNEGVEGYVNQRRLTNIGTFRKYVENYLRQTGFANLEMTFIVRQLQSTEKGVPIEIYMFCKEKAWAIYEGIQSDIFDHIIAMVPEFGLEVFQNPTSSSFRSLGEA